MNPFKISTPSPAKNLHLAPKNPKPNLIPAGRRLLTSSNKESGTCGAEGAGLVAGLYVRVSTLNQVDKDSLFTQESRLRAYC